MSLLKILNCRNTLVGAFYRVPLILPSTCTSSKTNLWQTNSFSSLCNSFNNTPNSAITLTPLSPLIIPNCGMKVKGRLKLRCKDCYFERKDGRMYVFCSSHPRHKQAAMIKNPKYSWIFTYAFQSKIRPY